MKTTNKELSEKFKINLARVRRWSREFLPPDPKATIRSGYTRELTIEEAYEVMLGGHLVSELGFQIHEARTIIEHLGGWMKSKGLYAGPEYKEARERNRPYFYHVHIMRIWGGKDFYYQLREYVTLPQRSKKDIDIIVEEYRDQVIGPKDAVGDWRNVSIFGATEFLAIFNMTWKGVFEKPNKVTKSMSKALELLDSEE